MQSGVLRKPYTGFEKNGVERWKSVWWGLVEEGGQIMKGVVLSCAWAWLRRHWWLDEIVVLERYIR